MSYRLEAGRDGKVGFYGCAASGRSRVVRCAFVGEGKPPRGVEVACPVCGDEHTVAPMWRKPLDADVGRQPEIVVEPLEVSA